MKQCSDTTNLRAHVMAAHTEWLFHKTKKKLDIEDKLVANDTGAIPSGTPPKLSSQ